MLLGYPSLGSVPLGGLGHFIRPSLASEDGWHLSHKVSTNGSGYSYGLPGFQDLDMSPMYQGVQGSDTL